MLIDRGNVSGKSFLVWVKYTGAWGKITLMKILPNISAYVSLKDFTPDLIFLHRYICHICEFCNSVRCKSLLVWFKCTGALRDPPGLVKDHTFYGFFSRLPSLTLFCSSRNRYPAYFFKPSLSHLNNGKMFR